MKSDVTAVVATMGESTLNEAIASLEWQSVGLEDIVLIRNVSPFTAAMNLGISKVKTPYFLQCDADMILDPDCVETLRAFMRHDTGVSIGYLNDELLGIIQAVKLYRTDYLKKAPFNDSITSDSDRISRMLDDGVSIAFARRPKENGDHPRDVLGRHRPNYADPLYVYGKFSLMGSAVRNRDSYAEFEGVLAALKTSKHPMADFALIAFCHGVFAEKKNCEHKPYRASEDFNFISEFVKRTNSSNRLFAITKLKGFDPSQELARLRVEE